MSQKHAVNDFECIEETPQFNKDFIKYNNEESDEGYFLEIDDLPFLSERIKLGKIEKLVTNLLDKTEHVIHIRNLKRALNHGLTFIQFVNLIKKVG